MENNLDDLKKEGYLKTKIIDGQEILHLSAPCRFMIDKEVVESLRNSYTPKEEIGGVLWAKPTRQDEENIFLVEKVTYLRNAIEDKPRNDNYNKSNAYLFDRTDRDQEFSTAFSQGCLPITFHTHPLKEKETLAAISWLDMATETSGQDRIESSLHYLIADKRLLMPRALIVGNTLSKREIFIGIYNGLIAPVEFKDSKQTVRQENLERVFDKMANINLTDAQKLGIIVGLVMLVFLCVKYPKYSLPIAMGLLATLPMFMTNTDKIENPNYFNKLSKGSAHIVIP